MLKLSKGAFELFYEVEKIPDFGLYIKDTMLSCKTAEQLANAFKWGKKIIWNKCDKVTKNLDFRDSLNIINRTELVGKDLVDTYDRCIKKLRQVRTDELY